MHSWCLHNTDKVGDSGNPVVGWGFCMAGSLFPRHWCELTVVQELFPNGDEQAWMEHAWCCKMLVPYVSVLILDADLPESQSQNSQNWKGPLVVIRYNPSAQAVLLLW